MQNTEKNDSKAYLCNVLAFGPIITGHLEGRQDTFLDVQRKRRFVGTWTNVDNSSVDKWEMNFVTFNVFSEFDRISLRQWNVGELSEICSVN